MNIDSIESLEIFRDNTLDIETHTATISLFSLDEVLVGLSWYSIVEIMTSDGRWSCLDPNTITTINLSKKHKEYYGIYIYIYIYYNLLIYF